jgi:hypothetical protein
MVPGQYSKLEGKVMKGTSIAASVLAIALIGAGSAKGSLAAAQDGDHVSQTQVKQMARDAHSPEQYKALAHYYDIQQKNYLKQAADEKQEWERRSQITTSLYAKYPKPADSARNLYEYYVVKASEAGALSTKYGKLAEPAGSASQQM